MKVTGKLTCGASPWEEGEKTEKRELKREKNGTKGGSKRGAEKGNSWSSGPEELEKNQERGVKRPTPKRRMGNEGKDQGPWKSTPPRKKK